MNKVTLYYIHDPMCSWCWAFRQSLQELTRRLPAEIEMVQLLGGLAEDSEQPMSDEMQLMISSTWKTIENKMPNVSFNFDFWQNCVPKRSTYPACRAVIAARRQGALNEKAMILAIQQAYYLQARNPSDRQTLVELAAQIGLDKERFARDLNSESVEQALLKEVNHARKMGVYSFPTLVLEMHGLQHHIPVNYINVDAMLMDLSSAMLHQQGEPVTVNF